MKIYQKAKSLRDHIAAIYSVTGRRGVVLPSGDFDFNPSSLKWLLDSLQDDNRLHSELSYIQHKMSDLDYLANSLVALLPTVCDHHHLRQSTVIYAVHNRKKVNSVYHSMVLSRLTRTLSLYV